MAKIETIKGTIKVDEGPLRAALSRLDLTVKKKMALEATLRGVDLDNVIKTMDHFWELIQPEYEKNLAALGVDPGAQEGDKTVTTTVITGKSCGTIIIDEDHS